MKEELEKYFSDYCKNNKLNLEVEDIKFGKMDYVKVKMSRPDTKESISCGFFRDMKKEEHEERKEFMLDNANKLFLKRL